MKKETSTGIKVAKVIGAVAVGIGLATGGLFIGDNAEQKALDLANDKIAELNAIEPTIVTETVTEIVTETVEVEVEKIVKVDNENLPMIMEYIVDNNGKLTDLDISEIDDEGVEELVSQIAFIAESKELALSEVKAELADEIDGDIITLADNSTMKLDEDDIKRIKMDDDHDEIDISDIDFEDGDADVTVTGSFVQSDVKFDYTAVVEIKDFEVDEIDSIVITERV